MLKKNQPNKTKRNPQNLTDPELVYFTSFIELKYSLKLLTNVFTGPMLYGKRGHKQKQKAFWVFFINRGFFIAWLLPTISSNRPKDKDRTLTDAKRTSLSEDTKDKVSYLVRHFWGVVPQWKYSLYFSYSQSKRIYPNRHSCLNLWSQYIQFTFYFCVSEMYVGIE